MKYRIIVEPERTQQFKIMNIFVDAKPETVEARIWSLEIEKVSIVASLLWQTATIPIREKSTLQKISLTRSLWRKIIFYLKKCTCWSLGITWDGLPSSVTSAVKNTPMNAGAKTNWISNTKLPSRKLPQSIEFIKLCSENINRWICFNVLKNYLIKKKTQQCTVYSCNCN